MAICRDLTLSPAGPLPCLGQIGSQRLRPSALALNLFPKGLKNPF